MALCLSAGFFWEYVTPLFRQNTVSDAMDLVCYAIGGSLYWLILKVARKDRGGQDD